MQKIKQKSWLFADQAQEHKLAFWLWNGIVLFLAGIGLGLLSLLLATGRYSLWVFVDYLTHPLVLALNLAPPVLLLALVYCLTGRGWVAFLTTAVPVMGLSIANYYKLLYRDDPLMFVDLSSAAMALKFAGDYHISLDWRLAFCLVCLLAGTLFLAFFVRGRLRGKRRLLGLIPVVLCGALLTPVYISADVYVEKTANYTHANQWSATQVYLCRGFVYPFLHSIQAAFPEEPEGYSEAAAEEILSAYTGQDIPEEKKVDVIAIQLEAFNDLTRLGIDGIDEAAYADFHQLEKESYTGNLLTNIFAGGTVDTERCFLTGDFTLDEFRKDTGSYAWYFQSQGYATEGAHPSYEWFYNRGNVNRYLGMQNYWYSENRYEALSGTELAMDDVLFPDLLYLYQHRDTSKPYFNLSVTYQGHGPYATDALEWGQTYWDGQYADEQTYYIVNNYLASVANTGKNLMALAQALQEEERPVVLVVFGDHNPWLGDGNSAWIDLGVDLDTSTETGFRNYYSTRYLIWANDAAKAVLDNDFVGEGPEISPCFLMNELFRQCGWTGSAYMQLMDDLMAQVNVINTNGFYEEKGVYTTQLSDEAQAMLQNAAIAQFYRKQNPQW